MKQLTLTVARWAIPVLILITSGLSHGAAFGKMINIRLEMASALHQDANPEKGELVYEDGFDTKKGVGAIRNMTITRLVTWSPPITM